MRLASISRVGSKFRAQTQKKDPVRNYQNRFVSCTLLLGMGIVALILLFKMLLELDVYLVVCI